MTCNDRHVWIISEPPNCGCVYHECVECSDFEVLQECEECYYERLEREDREEYGV